MGAGLDGIVKRVPSVAVGAVITAVTMLAWGGLYQSVPTADRESSSTAVTPGPPDDARGLAEPVPDCSSVYPQLRVCSQLPHRYMYGSEQEALKALKDQLSNSSLRIQAPRPTTGGPCPGTGQHYNVRDSRSPRDYPASIVCCPCCDDEDLGDPFQDRVCGIVAKDPGCDTRRRAFDASCAE